ncbi:hypothetical protein BgAZ_201480 [Babesia gibsoni]|uniref:Uncharacterized protein n=1 Tax=Babesia gibsoni TaxID=33632 RepID=A0AAD8LKI4_BABGI|nr:hypothetical protein BgAZ_201480 [Babesia gibsoni]
MPLCTIDDFEREVLIFDSDPSHSYLESSTYLQAYSPESSKYGIFVFYQGDVDGVCALFILEHHKRISNGLKLTSYPVVGEADIYTYIKKNLSIRSTYPDIKHEAYLRVLLLGVHGWDAQVLYAIKVHFSQLLPEEYRNDLRVCIVPAARPLSFFNVSFEGDWYFFVANEQEVTQEKSILERELVGGIYRSPSVASIIASITKTTHESSRAAILYASAVAVISLLIHYGAVDTSANKKITKIFQEIAMLNGGPYVQLDAERSMLPLISFTSLEEALRISPHFFIYDPQRKKDTLAEFRIYCNLLMEEFTSEFCNIDPKRQSQVLRQLNGRLKKIERSQLLWLRRSCTMPSVDMIYILLAISVGWINKENISTIDSAAVMASDFMYNTLTDRMSQDSFYDKVIIPQLKNKALQLMVGTYDMVSSSQIKSRMFGSHKVLFTTLYPKHQVTHNDELCFIAYLVSNIYSRGDREGGLCHVLVFIKNSDANGILAYGYSPEVSGNFPDIWALVFSSISHDDPSFVYDIFRPTCLSIRSDDFASVKNKISERLRIALESKQFSYFNDLESDTEEEASFSATDEDEDEEEDDDEYEEEEEEEDVQ